MTLKRTSSQPAVVDSSTSRLLPTPLRRRIPLRTLAQVRNEMARVYRRMDGGEIDSQDGTRAVYVLAQIGRIIEVAVLEQRITALEVRTNVR